MINHQLGYLARYYIGSGARVRPTLKSVYPDSISLFGNVLRILPPGGSIGESVMTQRDTRGSSNDGM